MYIYIYTNDDNNQSIVSKQVTDQRPETHLQPPS